MGLRYEDRCRNERIMALPDLPAGFRKYLLQTTLYTLQQMPEDSAAQREIMLEQDTESHWPNGNERHYRTARVEEEFYPGFDSLPATIKCTAHTTHDIRKPPSTETNTDISALIELNSEFSGDADTMDKDMFFLARRLEKFWRTVAAHIEPPLLDKEHNIVPEGCFGIGGYSQGENRAVGLQFNPADYQKVIAALWKMLLEVEKEVQAEAEADPIEQLLTGRSSFGSRAM